MPSPDVFARGIQKIIAEFGQVLTLVENGEAPRLIDGVITTVQSGNAPLVNAADVETIVMYSRANVPAPRKFASVTASNGKRYVVQETHHLDVKGVTVCYKSILRA